MEAAREMSYSENVYVRFTEECEKFSAGLDECDGIFNMETKDKIIKRYKNLLKEYAEWNSKKIDATILCFDYLKKLYLMVTSIEFPSVKAIDILKMLLIGSGKSRKRGQKGEGFFAIGLMV